MTRERQVARAGEDQGTAERYADRLAVIAPSLELVEFAGAGPLADDDLARVDAFFLSADAFPGRKIHGRIASFAPATGSEFALIPVENATGNFTKIVQRVPVRIRVPREVAADGHRARLRGRRLRPRRRRGRLSGVGPRRSTRPGA